MKIVGQLNITGITGNLINVFSGQTSRFIVKDDGNIGIGVTPTAKLHIKGDGSGSGTLTKFEDSDGAIRFLQIDNGGFSIGINGTEKTSNAQINVNAVSDGLAIVGARTGGLSGIKGDNVSLNFKLRTNTGTIETHSTIQHYIKNNKAGSAYSEMYINRTLHIQNPDGQSGRVKIRTDANPFVGAQGVLNVINAENDTTTTFIVDQFSQNTGLSLAVRSGNSGTSANVWNWRLKNNHEFEHNYGQLSTGDFILRSSNDQYNFFMDASADKIGIGDNTPSARLTVQGLRDDSAGDTFSTQNSGGTTTMVIEDGGNVGIGTAAPEGNLHLKGSDSSSLTTGLLVENSAGTNIFHIENDGAWALGTNSVPTTSTAVLIGDAVVAHFSQSVVIGDGASDGGGSPVGGAIVSIGAASQATINGGVAVGPSSRAHNSASSVAIGNAAVSSGGTSIGQSAISNGNGVSIGTQANSVGANGGTAVGLQATATGTQSTAVGRGATAVGATGAVALGNGATSSGGQAISLGYIASSTGATSIAIGVQSKAHNTRALAMGRFSESTGSDSMAIGYESKITGATIEAIAIGPGTQANAHGAIAMGRATSPSANKMTNSVVNSFGLGWEELTPSVLFAKTADSFISGSGNLGIGEAFKLGASPSHKLHVSGDTRLDVTTGSTATAGANTLPSNPLGFITINIQGNDVKIPYYAT